MTPPRRRVLIVEDSRVQAVRVQRVLEDAGYAVTVAPDGRAGVEQARAERPDLIISDVVMPRLDGYGLCREIRADAATRDIPIVLLTERRRPSDIVRGLDQGADNFITKPCTDAYLLERVARIFEHLALRTQGRMDIQATVSIGGRRMVLTADRQQMLELLLSTLDDLEAANQDLERKVRERTQALETLTQTLEAQVRHRTERLLQAEKLAWMGQLLAGVAHNLNNPMAVLLGHLQLLRRSAADPATVARITKMEAAAARCSDLINGFIRLARGVVDCQPVDLNGLVEDAVSLVGDLLREDRVEVSLALAAGLPLVPGDPSELHQVVVNLLTNARQALRDVHGPRRLRVRTEVDADGGRVCLTIADSGPGVAPAIAAKIFEPFTTTKAPGSHQGLGLALCDSIVKRHEGVIRLEPGAGPGATFRVELPVVRATAAEEAPAG
jgi:two-component system, sensor histidine kinase and response regulator